MSRSASSLENRTMGVPPTRSARFVGIASCGFGTSVRARSRAGIGAPTTITAQAGAPKILKASLLLAGSRGLRARRRAVGERDLALGNPLAGALHWRPDQRDLD